MAAQHVGKKRVACLHLLEAVGQQRGAVFALRGCRRCECGVQGDRSTVVRIRGEGGLAAVWK